ncbi:MAG: sulfite exporter TauE/SafE family protein [Acidobacteriales bacterium]|nr:sulfite exporter TauE/SafE family protein [Terriglobales bacterium]
MDDWAIIPAGFAVGVLIGLTSMGGAALMTPFLVLVAGVRPVLAVGTDLAYSAVTKIFGAWMHWRQGSIDFGTSFRLAMGSIPGGMLGVLSINWLRVTGHNVDKDVRRAIGIALTIVAVALILRAWRKNFGIELLRLERWPWLIPFWGFIVGFAVGLTSVGSGSLIAPLLICLYPESPVRAVGTDIFHACLLVIATATLHWSAGHVDWHLAAMLLIGSVPGVLLGSYLAPRLPQRGLRMGLGVVLLATALKMI